jgi:D-glutamate N-acetyltransferase
MTVSLELDREAQARGIASVFVPTGQTGIAIAGWGISVDAVVADFIAGAAERLVVEGSERGGELLLVEGQGSLVHPAYSGVTLGLVHGSAPHLFVLCHLAGSTEVEGYPGHPLPPLRELVELHERMALPARPARVACLAINTRLLEEDEARAAIDESERETGLPADDPVRFGPGRLLDAILTGVE